MTIPSTFKKFWRQGCLYSPSRLPTNMYCKCNPNYLFPILIHIDYFIWLTHGSYKIRVEGVFLLSNRFALSYGHRLTAPFINAHHWPQRWLVRSTPIAKKFTTFVCSWWGLVLPFLCEWDSMAIFGYLLKVRILFYSRSSINSFLSFSL